MKTRIILATLIALTGCEGDKIFYPDGVQQSTDRIFVSGRGTARSTPDIARVQLGVQTFDVNLDAAVAANNARSEAIHNALTQEGVAAADLQTSSFNVSVQRDYEREEPDQIVGFWVNNTVALTLRDLDRVGQVLQSALSAGANTVSNLLFAMDDSEPLLRQARTRAVEDARRRAQDLAQAAGIELGKVLSIQETSAPNGPLYGRGDFDAAADGAVPVQPGELEATVQVQVVFEID